MNSKHKNFLKGASALALTTGLGFAVAYAAGVYTNGLPLAGGSQYSFTIPLTGVEQGGFDTLLAGGQSPQTEAISVNQLKGFALAPVAAVLTGTNINQSLLDADLLTVTLAASSLLATPTNLVAGKRWQLEIIQSSSGSDTVTIPVGGIYKFNGGGGGVAASGIGLSTAANAIDLLSFVYDGTQILASTQTNFK